MNITTRILIRNNINSPMLQYKIRLEFHNSKQFLCLQRNCNNGFIPNNLFSSLSKSQEQSSMKQNNKYTLVASRSFSVKDQFESVLVSHSAVFQWITESSGVAFAKSVVVEIHDASGLPWWLSIILTTCLVRGLITFPIALYQVCRQI